MSRHPKSRAFPKVSASALSAAIGLALGTISLPSSA